MKRIITLFVVLLALLLPSSGQVFAQGTEGTNPAPQAVEATTAHTCLRFDNRQYEVCTAYVFNSSLGARLPYYKFANSTNDARRSLATEHFESRYRGSARSMIENQVTNWPSSVDVDAPRISITSVWVSSDHNRATLRTRESWDIRTTGGKVLFKEDSKTHLIRMSRVPGLILHKWVVTAIN